MTDSPPAGFELMTRSDAYSRAFGPIYINLAQHKIGFFVADRHLNPGGVCHGGALATFADLQFGAIRALLKSSRRLRPTVNLSLDYFAPAPLGAWVEAEVTLVSEALGIVTTRAVITANGRLAAQSRNIYHSGDDQA